MGVYKDISAIMCYVRSDLCPVCQKRGDTSVSTGFDGGMAVWIMAVRVDGRGMVGCVFVVLVQKGTKESLKGDTLIAPCVR